MENRKRILKYQVRDGGKSLVRFWATMLVVNILITIANRFGGENLNIGIMINDFEMNMEQVSIVGVALVALLIYLIVSNYENYYRGFPLAISFSTTRRDYGLSLVVKSILVVLVSSIIQAILFKVDPIIVDLAGKKVLHDFQIFNTKTDNIFYISFALWAMFLSFSSIWNLVASLNYRFGYIFWIVFFGIYFVSVSISSLMKIVMEIWSFLGGIYITRLDLIQFLKLSAVTIVCQGLAYFNIINTDIKHKSM